MATKLSKAAQSQITKLKEELAKAKNVAAKKIADQKLAAKEKTTKIKAKTAKTKKVYAYAFDTEPSGAKTKKPKWMGAVPKKLTVYKVRLMLDEQQIGIFGPYATIRAASADAKSILRMHVGPGYKIEEIGVDEPLLRSDGNVKVYFHPSVYSAQATDKGVLTAQVIEQGGEAQRKKAFVKKYNPARGGTKNGTRRARKNGGGSGAANAAYLRQSPLSDKVLRAVAKHYGVSTSEIKGELTDPDAEALYEYIGNDKALQMQVYRDFKSKGF